MLTTTVMAQGWRGYNLKARVFVGTCQQWCEQKFFDGQSADCTGYCGADYVNDKLVMKWNAEWDRGNAENWANPPYNAWENNEWNGMCDSCSGEVWHYKIVWVGTELESSPYWREGGYPIWGQFEVIMDQGTTSGEHMWFAHGLPTGYGA